MRILIAIIATISILAQTWDKLAIVAAYELQREYIASTLCENKSMPELHCEGSCMLSKKLSENTSGSDQPEPLRFNDREPLPMIYHCNGLMAATDFGPLKPINSRLETAYSEGHLAGIFHPPMV